MVHTQRQQIHRKDNMIKDLEGYIDNLLVCKYFTAYLSKVLVKVLKNHISLIFVALNLWIPGTISEDVNSLQTIKLNGICYHY